MQVTTFPQSYPQLHKSKTNPYFQLQGQKIKKIINQVNTILSHLLKDLEIIYKTNGLNYNIQHFYQTIVRILTPFQLLSHFHVIDNSDMFLGGTGREKDRFDLEMEYAQVGKVENEYQDYNYRDLNKKDTKQSLKLIPTGYQAQLQQSSQYDQNRQQRSQKPRKYKLSAQKAKKKRFYRRQMTKPILNPEIECELVQWVFKKLNENKRIRRKDIAQKALKLSGNQQGFEGSVGWVNRFLGRHKNLRQILTKRAKGNLGRKPDVFSDQDDQQIDKLHANELSYYTQNNSQTQNQPYNQQQNQLKQQYQQEHEQYQYSHNQDQSRNQSENRNQNQNYYQYQNQNQIQQYQRQKYKQNMDNKIKNQMINKNIIQNNRNNNTNGNMMNMNTNSYTHAFINNVKNNNNGKKIYRI